MDFNGEFRAHPEPLHAPILADLSLFPAILLVAKNRPMDACHEVWVMTTKISWSAILGFALMGSGMVLMLAILPNQPLDTAATNQDRSQTAERAAVDDISRIAQSLSSPNGLMPSETATVSRGERAIGSEARPTQSAEPVTTSRPVADPVAEHRARQEQADRLLDLAESLLQNQDTADGDPDRTGLADLETPDLETEPSSTKVEALPQPEWLANQTFPVELPELTAQNDSVNIGLQEPGYDSQWDRRNGIDLTDNRDDPSPTTTSSAKANSAHHRDSGSRQNTENLSIANHPVSGSDKTIPTSPEIHPDGSDPISQKDAPALELGGPGQAANLSASDQEMPSSSDGDDLKWDQTIAVAQSAIQGIQDAVAKWEPPVTTTSEATRSEANHLVSDTASNSKSDNVPVVEGTSSSHRDEHAVSKLADQEPTEPPHTQIPDRTVLPGQITFPTQLVQLLDDTTAQIPEIAGWSIQYRNLISQLCEAPIAQRRTILERLEAHRLKLDAALANRPRSRSGSQRERQVKQLGYALDRRLDFWQTVIPGNTILAARQQQQAGQIQLARSRRWDFSTARISPEWSEYLLWPEMKQVINDATLPVARKQQLAREILLRINSGTLTFQQESVITKLLPLDLQRQLYFHAQIRVELSEVLAAIESYEASRSPDAAMQIMEGYRWLRLSQSVTDQQMVHLIENHYRNANLRLTASREFINRWFVSQDWVNQTIAKQENTHVGIDVMPYELQLVPSEQGFHFQLIPSGRQQGTSEGWQSVPAPEPNTDSEASIISISFDEDEAPPLPTDYFDDQPMVGGNYQRIPFSDWMIRQYPQGMTGQIQEEVKFRTDVSSPSTLATELNQQLQTRLQRTQQAMERTLHGFRLAGLSPKVIESRSTASALTARFRIADGTQLASHSARPNPTPGAIMSLQVHESFFNNTLPRFGIAGKSFHWNALQEHFCQVLGLPASPGKTQPASTDRITFADQQAVEIDLEEGLILVSLRLKNANLAEQELGPIKITLAFQPMIDHCNVALRPVSSEIVPLASHTPSLSILESVNQHLTSLLQGQELQITPSDWQDDFLAKQLQITQCELSEGWLGISVESRPQPRVISLIGAESAKPQATTRPLTSEQKIATFLSDSAGPVFEPPANSASPRNPSSPSGTDPRQLPGPNGAKTPLLRSVLEPEPAQPNTDRRPVLRSVLE